MQELFMRDVKGVGLLYFKGAMLFLGGMLASAILLIERPSVKAALLLGVAVWCFARAYYFAFYVVEHYVDSSYKFSGLWSFVMYSIRRRKEEKAEGE